MKVIRNVPERLLEHLAYGDTFYHDFNDGNIYMKTQFCKDGSAFLCVNVETGSYEFFHAFDNVIPNECTISVKA